MSLVDENTIGVCGILGSTYNGEFDDLKGLNDALAELNKAKGWDVPIHVDAASGGFIAPFQYPDLEWDFRYERYWNHRCCSCLTDLCLFPQLYFLDNAKI